MASSTRQSELFAGQDWTVLYRAFTQINFNASDPPSIARALREYVRANYPEDFNDWIESSEFVAIIELLAWLAGTLAFRTDVSARENFLDTAEARESILRLARFLSYNPSRCRPGRGIVKLVELQTDEDVPDALGQSLAGVRVVWDDPNDPDWFEKWTTLLNSAFVSTNPFGTPLKRGDVGSSTAHLYRLNNLASETDFGFSSTVAGQRMDFEIINAEFDDNGALVERMPNPNAASHLIYLSDGNGNASTRTGFFLMFKQGTTRRETFQIATPIENLTLDLAGGNINEDDVWVQTIDDNGTVLDDWTKVPAILGENITYNSLPLTQRKVFAAITRDEDRVTLRFSDGRFADAPVGLLRTTYRVCNGLQYQIKPLEIDRVRIPVRYIARNGTRRTLFLTFSLFESVQNATARETEEQIRRRAPLVYAAQNRMVSGEDYNTFPLATNLAVKIKAVNRVYSGHSRYTAIHDPTGNYADLNVIAEDGILFRETADAYSEVPASLNRTPRQIIDLHIQPMLRLDTVALDIRDAMWRLGITVNATWTQATVAAASSTGRFDIDNVLLRPGAILLMRPPGAPVDGSQDFWTAITDMTAAANGLIIGGLGPVILNARVVTGSTILGVIPRFAPGLPSDIAAEIDQLVESRFGFSLWYDHSPASNAPHWSIGPVERSPGPATFDGTKVRVLTANYTPGLWRFWARGSRYVFESERAVEWYAEGRKSVDTETGTASVDVVRVLGVNVNRNDADGRPLRRNIDFRVGDLYYYADGSAEPRRTLVGLPDSDEDGQPDMPDAFYRVIPALDRDSLLFWRRTPDGLEEPIYTVVAYPNAASRTADSSRMVGTVGYDRDTGFFHTFTGTSWTQAGPRDYKVAVGRGPNVAEWWSDVALRPVGDTVMFNWRHFASSERRIDPAPTNIVDVFVLSSEYDFQIRQWIANGSDVATMPLAPSELDLRLAFASLESFRMFSDQIVWRPVRYKMLFGPGAAPELRAQFKIVKLMNAALSDGEIRSRVIRAVNEYFDASRWDFGETFYYTELAAFIHQRLAGSVGSVVIVPMDAESAFGEVFEVRARPDELFISTAQVADVVIIPSNTPGQLRIR